MARRFKLILLSTVTDERGRITIAQEPDHVPFDVGRMFIIDGVPRGATRAGHAHREQHELVFMIQGECTAVIDDGDAQENLRLNRLEMALYIPPMTWLELSDFSEDAVCGVLASGRYDRSGYISDVTEFRQLAVRAGS